MSKAIILVLFIGVTGPACHLFMEDDWGWEEAACNNSNQCQDDLACIGGWCVWTYYDCTNKGDCTEHFGGDAFCNSEGYCDYEIREFWQITCNGSTATCGDGYDDCAIFPIGDVQNGSKEYCTYPCMDVAHCPPNTVCLRIDEGFRCGAPEWAGGLGNMCFTAEDCVYSTEALSCVEVEFPDRPTLDYPDKICTRSCTPDQNNCPDGYGCCDPKGGTDYICLLPDMCPII